MSIDKELLFYMGNIHEGVFRAIVNDCSKLITPVSDYSGFTAHLAAVERTLTAHESISLNPLISSCSNQLPLSMVKPYGGANAPHWQDHLVEAVDNQAD